MPKTTFTFNNSPTSFRGKVRFGKPATPPYSIGGASPELVAAFLTAADGTTEGEYFRKVGSDTDFSMFTFSRSNNATMFPSTGTLVWAPHNLALQSNAFDTSPWVVDSNITVTQTGAGPYSQDTWNIAASAGGERNTQAVSGFVSGDQYQWNLFVKKTTGASTFPLFWVDTNTYQVILNTDTGVLTTRLGSPTILSSVDTGDGFWLVRFKFVATGTSQSIGIFPAGSSDGTTYDASATGSMDCFGLHLYRSDLGGMADNPDQTVSGLEKYVPTTSAAAYLSRRNAYYYNSGWTKGGLQLEPAAATNLHIYSTDFSQATWVKGRGAITSDAKTGLDGNTGNFLFTVNTTSAGGASCRDSNLTAFTAVEHCHWGVFEAGASNWVILYSYDGSNNHTWFDLSTGAVGTTTGTNRTGIVSLGDGKYLCWHAWTAQVGTTLPSFYVPTGDGTFACQTADSIYCYHMQCEVGSFPTSPIITTGSTVTRAAETLSIAGADTPANTTAVSISMKGLMTYADEDAAAQETFLRWYADANNFITLDLDTDSTATGEVNANQSAAGTLDTVVAGAEYSPGVNVAFNIASRHTSGAINVAKDGTAATADTTPTALADLSSTALTPGYDFNGFISELRIWGTDIGDSGIVEVTS